MNKKLPIDTEGFTLVELLVVVTIIIILMTIGITLFSTATANAKKAKVRADVDSISKAMETNWDPVNRNYTGLSSTSFAREPKKPGTTAAYTYPVASPATATTWTSCYNLTTGENTDTACTADGDNCRCIKSAQ